MILFLTCFNSRPKVSELFLQHFKRHDLLSSLLVGITEANDADLCIKYGVKFIRLPNNPLGQKWNGLVFHAFTIEAWTHAVMVGDDDILHPEVLLFYQTTKSEPHIVYGLESIDFIDPIQKRAHTFTAPYTITNKPIGAGKMIHRSMLRKAGFKYYPDEVLKPKNMEHVSQPLSEAEYFYLLDCGVIGKEKQMKYELFNPNWNNRMDFSCDYNLIRAGAEFEYIPTHEPLVVDIKLQNNLWSYDQVTYGRGYKANYDLIVDKYELDELEGWV